MCLYVFTCVWLLCMCAYMHAEARDWHLLFSTITFYLLHHNFSLNPNFTDSAHLLNHLGMGIFCLSVLSIDWYYSWAIMLPWHLFGCWRCGVLTLIQHSLFHWNYLPSSTSYFATGSPYLHPGSSWTQHSTAIPSWVLWLSWITVRLTVKSKLRAMYI